MRNLQTSLFPEMVIEEPAASVERMTTRTYRRMLTNPARLSGEQYWARIARVALARFPELDRGERVSDRELNRTFARIRETGYGGIPKNYGGMTRDEKWEYLIHGIRPDVWSNADRYCPDVAREIRERNEESRLSASL